jgi:hypothetical protein
MADAPDWAAAAGVSPAVVPSPLTPCAAPGPAEGDPPTGAPTLSRPGGVGVSAACGAGVVIVVAPPAPGRAAPLF